jgi:ferredoxin-NADP reductase
LRALLEDLPETVDTSVVLRGPSRREVPLANEFAHLVKKRRGQLHQIIGSGRSTRITASLLSGLIPDLAHRDVFVCGPRNFTEAVTRAAHAMGTPPERIHHETFAF